MLGRTRRNINMHTANRIYNSFILPVFDYCDSVSCMELLRAYNHRKLEKLQRRTARLSMREDSSDRALEKLQYISLERRLEKHILKLVNKCLSKKYPQFLIDYFTFNTDVLTRRTR